MIDRLRLGQAGEAFLRRRHVHPWLLSDHQHLRMGELQGAAIDAGLSGGDQEPLFAELAQQPIHVMLFIREEDEAGGRIPIVDLDFDPIATAGIHGAGPHPPHLGGEGRFLPYFDLADGTAGQGVGHPEGIIDQGIAHSGHTQGFESAEPPFVGHARREGGVKSQTHGFTAFRTRLNDKTPFENGVKLLT